MVPKHKGFILKTQVQIYALFPHAVTDWVPHAESPDNSPRFYTFWYQVEGYLLSITAKSEYNLRTVSSTPLFN